MDNNRQCQLEIFPLLYKLILFTRHRFNIDYYYGFLANYLIPGNHLLLGYNYIDCIIDHEFCLFCDKEKDKTKKKQKQSNKKA